MIVATVSGNLGQDAELKTTPGGDAVLSFSVASTDKVKQEKVTTWIRATIWGKRASSLAPFLTKGTRVCVVGQINLREYTSQGEKKTSVDMRVDQLDLMGGGERQEQAPARQAPREQHGFGRPRDAFDNSDDIPF
jgi:single-strand DNA-binding protein